MANTGEQKPPDAFMTPGDIERELAVSRSSAYALLKRMRHIRDGRIIRVRRSDFEAWLKAQTKPGVPPVRTRLPPYVPVKGSKAGHRRLLPPVRAAQPTIKRASQSRRELPPEPVDYEAFQAKRRAAVAAAIERLKTTPVADIPVAERKEMRRLFSRHRLVELGLIKLKGP